MRLLKAIAIPLLALLVFGGCGKTITEPEIVENPTGLDTTITINVVSGGIYTTRMSATWYLGNEENMVMLDFVGYVVKADSHIVDSVWALINIYSIGEDSLDYSIPDSLVKSYLTPVDRDTSWGYLSSGWFYYLTDSEYCFYDDFCDLNLYYLTFGVDILEQTEGQLNAIQSEQRFNFKGERVR